MRRLFTGNQLIPQYTSNPETHTFYTSDHESKPITLAILTLPIGTVTSTPARIYTVSCTHWVSSTANNQPAIRHKQTVRDMGAFRCDEGEDNTNQPYIILRSTSTRRPSWAQGNPLAEVDIQTWDQRELHITFRTYDKKSQGKMDVGIVLGFTLGEQAAERFGRWVEVLRSQRRPTEVR